MDEPFFNLFSVPFLSLKLIKHTFRPFSGIDANLRVELLHCVAQILKLAPAVKNLFV